MGLKHGRRGSDDLFPRFAHVRFAWLCTTTLSFCTKHTEIFTSLSQASNYQYSRIINLPLTAFVYFKIFILTDLKSHTEHETYLGLTFFHVPQGHDTISTAICWTLFLLGLHPDVQVSVKDLMSFFW
jgi:hypothetical protein